MTVRDSLARRFSGGPPFRVDPSTLLVEVNAPQRVEDVQDSFSELKGVEYTQSKFEELGFEVKRLENYDVLKVHSNSLESVLDRIEQFRDEFSEQSLERIQSLRDRANGVTTRTIVGASDVFSDDYSVIQDSETEACLRRCLVDKSLSNDLTQTLTDIAGVVRAEMVYTRTTFGPRNLRVNPSSMNSVLQDTLSGEEDGSTLRTIAEKLDMEEVWEKTRGEDATVAIFDMGFCREFVDEDRVVDTFSGDSVESAFSELELEGHGSMSAMSAAGDTSEGAPFNGMAPDADLLLVRLTDDEGAITNTEEAWDWFLQKLDEIDGPVISNHSYGIPLCGARAMGLCDATSTQVAREAAERDNHIAVYAAGNEATYCGRRLSGITNGINGINSDASSITVGALRSDGREAQQYSSHGFGTCTSRRENPKPDVSAPIPGLLPYGCDVKDMRSGIGGSNGGTSTAAPITAGVCALLASHYGEADKELIEEALEETAKLPRTTQVNFLSGYDARFGHGAIRPLEAIERIEDRLDE